MKIFALADPHLSFAQPAHTLDHAWVSYKAMDIFGERWRDHPRLLAERWQDTVDAADLVLMAGDISWAMTLTEARHDLDFLDRLKGRKILIKGNHDYWWHGINKIRTALPPSLSAIQNDAVILGDWAVCGTRLWDVPGSRDFKATDRKIYERELIRLGMSLQAAAGRPIINMTHYPPCNEQGADNEVLALLQSYPVAVSVYGHLHDVRPGQVFEGRRGAITFHLTSCDYLDFTPKLVATL